MNDVVIKFEFVSKSYPLYHHFTGGIKKFLFHLPHALHSLRHSRFEALKDISFDVRRGETLGIIGKNGAGKSTVLGLIAGILKPSAGAVSIMGRIVPLLELGSGFHPELSGRENILLNGILLGMTKKQVLSKLDEIIEFSELGQFIEQPIRTYSSGMLARLGFSVVAHLDYEIMLIDEILAVGDTAFQQKCYAMFDKFKQAGKTIVLVSHDLNTIEKFCDRAILIEKGRIQKQGVGSSVVNAYKLAVDNAQI
jgi:lipopolysaccharide transport system ATP-binding protein